MRMRMRIREPGSLWCGPAGTSIPGQIINICMKANQYLTRETILTFDLQINSWCGKEAWKTKALKRKPMPELRRHTLGEMHVQMGSSLPQKIWSHSNKINQILTCRWCRSSYMFLAGELQSNAENCLAEGGGLGLNPVEVWKFSESLIFTRSSPRSYLFSKNNSPPSLKSQTRNLSLPYPWFSS